MALPDQMRSIHRTAAAGLAVVLAVASATAGLAQAPPTDRPQPPASTGKPAAPPPAWFVAMDTNGDGYVTREEFLAARLAMFRELDRDGNGWLDRDEFRKLAQPPYAEAGADAAAQATRLRFFDAQFDSIDVDGDDRVDRDEIETFAAIDFLECDFSRDGRLSKSEALHCERRRGQAPQGLPPEGLTVQEFIALEIPRAMQFDADGDGRIGRDEFLVTAGPPDGDPRLPPNAPPYAQRRAIALQRFTDIDRNRDGFLDRDELTAYFVRSFKEIDANGDGRITEEEVRVHNLKPPPAPPPPSPVAPPKGDTGLPLGPNLPTR